MSRKWKEIKEIIEEYPNLTKEDILACLFYKTEKGKEFTEEIRKYLARK